MKYTKEIESLAEELGVDFSIALDIDYLRTLEKRISETCKKIS